MYCILLYFIHGPPVFSILGPRLYWDANRAAALAKDVDVQVLGHYTDAVGESIERQPSLVSTRLSQSDGRNNRVIF